MKRIIQIGVALAVALLLPLSANAFESPNIKTIEPPQRVLFVGNSFSYFNNGLHNHTSNLVRAIGDWNSKENRFRLSTLSGGRFEEQLGIVSDLMSQPGPAWDMVVLQGHSRGPLLEEADSKFRQSVAELVDIVRKKGAEPALFMTWHYQGKPEMTAPLADGYTNIGNQQKALVVPVGLAFSKAAKQYPEISLHSKDYLKQEQGNAVYKKAVKHPSLEGTYLAACVFYSTFFRRTAEGNPYHAGLSKETALKLQRIAWATVADFYKD